MTTSLGETQSCNTAKIIIHTFFHVWKSNGFAGNFGFNAGLKHRGDGVIQILFSG